MELPMTSTAKRSISAILALCTIAAFNTLRHDMPVVKNISFMAVFIILASLGIYIALTSEKSSILNRISAVAVAIGFSLLSIAFSGSFGLSSFSLANGTDVMSVSFLMIAIIGLLINGMTGERHSHGEGNG
jgi:hypothetical protein